MNANYRERLKDKKRILPICAWLEGEYGYKNLFLGVLGKLGQGGLEQIVEIDLSTDEKKLLDKSAEAVQQLIQVLESNR